MECLGLGSIFPRLQELGVVWGGWKKNNCEMEGIVCFVNLDAVFSCRIFYLEENMFFSNVFFGNHFPAYVFFFSGGSTVPLLHEGYMTRWQMPPRVRNQWMQSNGPPFSCSCCFCGSDSACSCSWHWYCNFWVFWLSVFFFSQPLSLLPKRHFNCLPKTSTLWAINLVWY